MLKGFIKATQGSSLRFRLVALFWELRYAWQRAWRGYDDTDVFDFNNNFLEKIVCILKDFNEHNVSLFVEADGSIMTAEETKEVVDKMIYFFSHSDGDKESDPLFGELDMEAGRFEFEPSIEELIACFDKAKENRQAGLELFKMYFDCLWY